VTDAVDPETYRRLRRIADELAGHASDLEGAWAFEIGAQGVIVMMSPVKRHESIATRIVLQLNAQLPGTHPGAVAQSGAEIEDPSIGRMRRPDVVVLPLAVLDSAGDTVDPHDVLAVGEVVSRNNPENDYRDKMQDYPAMGIALYLLVDPRNGTVHVHSDPATGPEGPEYRARHSYTFGDKVPLGPWSIDTSEFPTYSAP
jgi:Uma2 family endonuclease